MHANDHSSTIYNSKVMEATQVSINRQIGKEDVAYRYTVEYYSAIKRVKFCHMKQHGWTWRVLC